MRQRLFLLVCSIALVACCGCPLKPPPVVQAPIDFTNNVPPQYVPKQPIAIVDVGSGGITIERLQKLKNTQIGPITIKEVLEFPGSTDSAKRSQSKVCGSVALLFEITGEVTEASLNEVAKAINGNPELKGNVIFIQPNGIEGVMQVSASASSPDLWAYDAVRRGFGGFPKVTNVRVVVVDTGVNSQNNNSIGVELIAPKNFVYWKSGDSTFTPTTGTSYGGTRLEDVVDDYVDKNGITGHGTQIAGIIAAPSNSSTKLGGVAPGAQIVPVKSCDGTGKCTSVSVAQGICHALSEGVNAQIVNLSLGYLDENDPAVKLAVEDVRKAGVLVVAAGGNVDKTQNNPLYPAAFSRGDDGIVAVGAIEPQPGGTTDYAALSNTGSYIDIVAPGKGVAAYSPTQGVVSVEGTSFATAFVSGAAAQIIARLTGVVTPRRIEASLVGNKSKCGTANPSCGKGLLQIEADIPLSDVLNIEQFGGKPNDQIDDTEAMQKAADAICSSPPGTTLIYPPGVYNINKILTNQQAYSGNPRDSMIVYPSCHDVVISGYGAKIDIKGDFIKNKLPSPTASCVVADKYGFIPFAFSRSYRFSLKGFEIDGNVDLMRTSDPGTYCAGTEIGIIVGGFFNDPLVPFPNYSYDLVDLYVHHMAQEGIDLSGSREVTLERVIIDKNADTGMWIGTVQNLEVLNSKITNTGQDNGPGDSFFRRAVNMEFIPACGPEDADWAVSGCPGYPLTGNILFDGVEISGARGWQFNASNGHALANITIRNSLIKGHAESGALFLMGVTGAVIENSTIDAQGGHLTPCFSYFDVQKQHNSPVFQKYLNQMADDTSPIAQKIYRERKPILTSRIQGNTITGKNTLLNCEGIMPELLVLNNTFIGQQDATSTLRGLFPSRRYIYIAPTKNIPNTPTTAFAPFAKVANNSFSIPQAVSIPPGEAVARIVGVFYDQIELVNNQFTTDGTASKLHVIYDHVKSVSNDQFPLDDSIVPVRGPRYPGPPFNDPVDYPAYQPYPLANGFFNFP